MPVPKRVAYISGDNYHTVCDRHPKIKGRASLVDSLIESYGLKSSLVSVIPKPASKNDIMAFHSKEYADCLEKIQNLMEANFPQLSNEDSMYEEDIDYDNDEEFSDVTKYGFGYDCGVFPQIYDYCAAVTGGTIAAADILIAKKADITINLNGGWHHAHVDEAAGFCYVNDIVVGILKLLKTFKRVLYVDLDIHHGDAVEEAFKYSKKVMTLSLHNYEDGFFPGTGGGEGFHNTCSNYFAANVPLKNGVDDKMFQDVFLTLFDDITKSFEPDVIVCQCGADGLHGDPLGNFNLTSAGFVRCVEEICSKNVPVMLLGGGGYNVTNTARCWTEIVATVLGKKLADDIPDHENLEKYGPDYSLAITSGNRKNENTQEYVNGTISLLKESIRLIFAPDEKEPVKSTDGASLIDPPEKDNAMSGNFAEDVEDVEKTPRKEAPVIDNISESHPVKRLLDTEDGIPDQSPTKKMCIDETTI